MTTKKLYRRYLEFRNLNSIEMLAGLLDTPVHALILQAGMPQYSEFYRRKRRGGRRLIENPWPVLKEIQRKLNRFLQASYYFQKTKAAQGFILSAKNKKKRNIVSNAKRHLNSKYLVNIDLRDFFHCINVEKVHKIFRSDPFRFPVRLTALLSNLCCYKSRLPMGAPTSPALTNFYCIGMDRELDRYADERQFEFTRYVDDMSFSSKTPIQNSQLEEIREIIGKYDLQINDDKTRKYTPGEKKLVTGIYVSDRLELSPDLLRETGEEIGKLRSVVEVSMRHGRSSPDWVRHYKQRISGYLQFAQQVLGPNDELLVKMKQDYKEALHPPDPVDPVSWSELPYIF